MAEPPPRQKRISKAAMEARLVRYADLRPCFNAFIDTRTPGSEEKENFTIIGPGVSENPEQYVHIREPHGFNIGAARQPPGCVNSQHSHNTAEVFVVHSGRWRFDLGETGEDAQVELDAGDVISIPTNIFRGFTNIGEGTGLLWAVLGEDNPGRVTWAPAVFELAKDYGLVLLENGQLVDLTRGESVPEGVAPMAPTSPLDAERLRRVSLDEAEKFVWKSGPDSAGELLLIGANAHFGWPHGFTLSVMALEAASPRHFSSTDPKVIFVHRGRIAITWDGEQIEICEGDTISIPDGIDHEIASNGGDATIYIVRRARS